MRLYLHLVCGGTTPTGPAAPSDDMHCSIERHCARCAASFPENQFVWVRDGVVTNVKVGT
jgi:hypothetical protein